MPSDSTQMNINFPSLHEPSDTVPVDTHPASLQALRRGLAEDTIKAKWQLLNGAPGNPKTPGDGGLIGLGEGFYREYDSGVIYVISDEAFHVFGAIGERYNQLGRPNSWLGWPTSDEQDFAQDGRASTFEHGAIYWWPDTGAIELGNVVVRHTGILCFGETDWDQGSGEDEPYVIFGVVPSPPAQPVTIRTRVWEDVDGGEAVADNLELYRGLPYGLALGVVLMEHDFGDPDKYRDQVKIGVEKASEGVSFALQHIPIVGPTLGKLAEVALKEFGPAIVNEVNDLLDTQDDTLGAFTWNITAKEMVTLTRVGLQNFRGVDFRLQSELISSDGASYKVCLDIHAG